MIDDGDTLAQLVGFFHVMGGQDNGDPTLLKFADDVPQCQTRLRIEACTGLIQEEHFGIVGDGASDLDPLREAAGKGLNKCLGGLGQLE